MRIRGAEPAEHTARTQQTFTLSYLSKLCVATILLRPRHQLKLGKSLWEQDEDEDWGGVLFNWKHANLGILHMVAIKWLWKHVNMSCPCLYNSLNSCEYTGPHRLTWLTKIDLPCFFSLRALQGQHRQKWVSGLCIINTFFLSTNIIGDGKLRDSKTQFSDSVCRLQEESLGWNPEPTKSCYWVQWNHRWLFNESGSRASKTRQR